MSKINEMKRELSKLSGLDYFNPKFRDVFKKYFPDDVDEEEERANELLKEDNVEDDGDKKEESPADTEKVEDKEEDVDKAEDEREIDKIEEDKAETPEEADEKEEDKEEESHEIGKDVDDLKDDKTKDELLDAKIELELIKNGVNPDRLDSAKKYAKYEIKSLDELDKVKDLIKEFPEWVRSYHADKFGYDIDKQGDGLTAEERRLKEMGIDPND